MRDLIKRLLRMVAGYGAVQWAGPFLSLIFTPIFTRILTPGDYGVADYLSTIVSALSTLALFALPQALTIHFNDRPDDTAWRRTVTGSAFALATLSGIVFGLLLILFAPTLTAYVPIIGPYGFLVQVIGATFVFGLISAVLAQTAQSALRVRWGMIFSSIAIVSTIAGNLLFIVVLRWGVVGMILTPIVTGMTVSLTSILLVRGMIGRPAPPVMGMLVRSGAILVPTMLAAWVLQVSDRLFLAHYVSETELGYYAVANKMAALIYVVMAPVYSTWTPLALAVQHSPRAREQYVNMSRYVIAVVLMAGLGVGLFATEILTILTRPAYLPAAPYVGFVAYMQVFSGFGAVLSTGAMMGKQLVSMSGAVVLGALLNILFNILLVPPYGVWGATIATVIGSGVPILVLYFWLQRRYPIPYPAKSLAAALTLQLGILICGLFVPPLWFPLRVGVKLLLFSLLPLGYVVLRIITPFELKQTGLFLRHRVTLLRSRR